MGTQVKTFEISKRGRKYFACRLGRYSAKLVVNEVSGGLSEGDKVTVEVKDRSVRSGYGTQLKFEPVRLLDAADKAALTYRRDIEQKLEYAMSHVADGLCRTKSILAVLEAEGKLPELAKEIADLKAKVEVNKQADEERKKARAAECAEERKQWAEEKAARRAELNSSRVLMPLSNLPPVGTPMRLKRVLGDQVVVFTDRGKRFRIDENEASFGNPHLLGYEGSFGCYCYFRPATEAETAAVDEKDRIRTEQTAARKRAAEIGDRIQSEGERPTPPADGLIRIDGDRLLDTADAYGGGDCFDITDDSIWYVRNNGMDGDCWGHNNIRTGGAGAIGCRPAGPPSRRRCKRRRSRWE